MTKQTITRLIFLSLLTTMFVSCGSSTTNVDETVTDGQDTVHETVEQVYVYPYPENGFGGEEITFLSTEPLYSFQSLIDSEKQTGEALNDALYDRCRLVEEKLDIVLNELTCQDIPSNLQMMRKSVMANDQTYDFVYAVGQAYNFKSIVNEGLVLNLLDVDTIQLDQSWWYDNMNDPLTINNRLFFAYGASNLVMNEWLSCLAFNHDMMDTLNLEYPYDLVREGKWTFDVFGTYLKAAANLNGDESWLWNPEGNCVYGYSVQDARMDTAIIYSGLLHVYPEDDRLVTSYGSSRFYDVLEKYANILDISSGMVAKAGNSLTRSDLKAAASVGDYVYIFMTQRALFGHSEITDLKLYRDLPFEYGIVPYPKYDETQDRYYSMMGTGVAACLPITCADPEMIGTVLDALSYEGERMVLPVYFENTVEQKGLRNEDSIEMLQILRDTAVPHFHGIFGIDKTISMLSSDKIDTIASTVAKLLPAMEKQMEEALEGYYRD